MTNSKDIGLVIEALADARFMVRMEKDASEVMCYLAGKLRHNNVNIRVGDRVEVKLDPAGGKATNRIVWRV